MTDEAVFAFLKDWGGHALGGVITVAWMLNKTGIFRYFSRHRLLERRLDAQERKDHDDSQDSLISQLRSTLNELDERCRRERVECDQRHETQAAEISLLQKGLVAVMDYAGYLWAQLDARNIAVKPPPDLDALKDTGD